MSAIPKILPFSDLRVRTWRAEMLRITWSGSAGNPITIGSYPADCADQPVLSGAQPIGGWTPYATNIYGEWYHDASDFFQKISASLR